MSPEDMKSVKIPIIIEKKNKKTTDLIQTLIGNKLAKVITNKEITRHIRQIEPESIGLKRKTKTHRNFILTSINLNQLLSPSTY
tara:strand:+ start:1390 stop:1641 length:252 start_codon:yes stop_codon:yes gene_type:complete